MLINGTVVDVTEYNGRPQDQLPDETDVSYYYFLLFISDMHTTASQMIEDAKAQKEICDRTGDMRYIPSESAIRRWSARHSWKRRRAVYNKIQMEDMKQIIHKGRVTDMERFFGNREQAKDG